MTGVQTCALPIYGIHVLECAKIGADVMTAPPAVIKSLANHVLTEKGLEAFTADWAKTGQSIPIGE